MINIAKNSENLAIVYDDVEIALGALATKTAVGTSSKIDSARRQGFRVMKTEYFMDYHSKTADQGPIMFGFSANHGVADIAEAIVADPQASEDDEPNMYAKRPVWPLEMISYDSAGLGDNGKGIGAKGTFNPRWSVPEENGATWWAFNMDANPLTTGGKISVFAKHYGVWLKD